MEDQPAHPGDLTTEAELPAQPADAAASSEASRTAGARRKHRMPLRKQMADGGGEDAATPADESAPEATAVTEVTQATEATEAVEAVEPAPARRRWFGLRRRPKTAPGASEPDAALAPEAAPAPRRPVGKAARTATVKPADEPDRGADLAEEPDTLPDQQPTESALDTSSDTESAAAPDTEPDTEPEPESDTAQEVRFVAHRPAGKRLVAASVATSALFVAAAGFAGAMALPYLEDRAEGVIKLDVARTAANALTTLGTYTPEDMESLGDRSAKFLGGDFAEQYRSYIDAIVAPNKQAQITSTTDVLGAAVETLTPSEATALVYTNSVATSPLTKNIPSLRYLSYRVTMERQDADWVIIRMPTITSLDLTPQL